MVCRRAPQVRAPSTTAYVRSSTCLTQELPQQGAKVQFDKRSGASWSFDAQNGQLVSYDSPEAADAKVKYIQSKGLRGAMFWDLSGDLAADDDRSLVRLFAKKVRK